MYNQQSDYKNDMTETELFKKRKLENISKPKEVGEIEKEVVHKRSKAKPKEVEYKKIIMNINLSEVTKCTLRDIVVYNNQHVTKFNIDERPIKNPNNIMKDIEKEKKLKREIEKTNIQNKLKNENAKYLTEITNNYVTSFEARESRNNLIVNKNTLNKIEVELEEQSIRQNNNLNSLNTQLLQLEKLLSFYENQEFQLGFENNIKFEQITTFATRNLILKENYSNMIKNRDSITTSNNILVDEIKILTTEMNRLHNISQQLLTIKEDNNKSRLSIMQQNLVLKPYYKKFLLIDFYSNTDLKFKVSDNKKTISIKLGNYVNNNNISKNPSKNSGVSNSINNDGLYYKADKIITLKDNQIEFQAQHKIISFDYIVKEFTNVSFCFINRLLSSKDESNQIVQNNLNYIALIINTSTILSERFLSYANSILKELLSETIKIGIYEYFSSGGKAIIHESTRNYGESKKINAENMKFKNSKGERESIKFRDDKDDEGLYNEDDYSIGYGLKINFLSNGNDYFLMFINTESRFNKEDVIDIVKFVRNSVVTTKDKETSKIQLNKKKVMSPLSKPKRFLLSKLKESAFTNFDIKKVKYSNLFIDCEAEKLIEHKEYIDLINN